jgi:uncharacterized protein YeaO (DUF488 family)
MIKVKNFLEDVEDGDGQRIWVEPLGLTRDLRDWCKVAHVLTHLGPPRELWNWFEEHPDGYDYFRGKYHEHLGKGPYRSALQALANASLKEDFTLLHQGDDAAHNTGTALFEFLSELGAYCPHDDDNG